MNRVYWFGWLGVLLLGAYQQDMGLFALAIFGLQYSNNEAERER